MIRGWRRDVGTIRYKSQNPVNRFCDPRIDDTRTALPRLLSRLMQGFDRTFCRTGIEWRGKVAWSLHEAEEEVTFAPLVVRVERSAVSSLDTAQVLNEAAGNSRALAGACCAAIDAGCKPVDFVTGLHRGSAPDDEGTGGRTGTLRAFPRPGRVDADRGRDGPCTCARLLARPAVPGHLPRNAEASLEPADDTICLAGKEGGGLSPMPERRPRCGSAPSPPPQSQVLAPAATSNAPASSWRRWSRPRRSA